MSSHGFTRLSASPEQKRTYKAWCYMKKRCLNEKCDKFRYYGGRGVQICQDWESFENFVRDMGIAPSSRHSIDRINNNLGYSKGNCRWATQLEQARNKSNNFVIIENGVKTCVLELSKTTGLNQSTIWSRIRRNQNLSGPLRRRRHLVTINGERKSLAEWSEISGLNHHMLYKRLSRGWAEEDLLKGSCHEQTKRDWT